jgi:hypothetical protein
MEELDGDFWHGGEFISGQKNLSNFAPNNVFRINLELFQKVTLNFL